MYPILYKYFAIQRQFSLPGLGCFIVEDEPAQLDFIHKVIHPPLPLIKFTSDCADVDRSQLKFIARELKTDDNEAARLLHEFSDGLRYSFESVHAIELPFVGTLSQGEKGLIFDPAQTVGEYYADVAAERVIRENQEHNILVGDAVRTNTQMIEHFTEESAFSKPVRDLWWLFAIVLGAIAVAAIVYYYVYVQPRQYV